jgi:large subunit ribosomal protein L31
MQKDIHPEYRFVVFKDITCDFQIVTRSCVQSNQTTEIDGVEYPLVNIDISSASHPFYTGTQRIMDTAGRVERFYRKYGFTRPDEPGDEPAAEQPEAPAES